MAVAEPQLLEAGWTPAGPRLFSHPYGEAVFDVHEAVTIQARRMRREPRPRLAPMCRCRFPLVDREAEFGRRCAKRGRRVVGAPLANRVLASAAEWNGTGRHGETSLARETPANGHAATRLRRPLQTLEKPVFSS